MARRWIAVVVTGLVLLCAIVLFVQMVKVALTGHVFFFDYLLIGAVIEGFTYRRIIRSTSGNLRSLLQTLLVTSMLLYAIVLLIFSWVTISVPFIGVIAFPALAIAIWCSVMTVRIARFKPVGS